jgi:glycosyltransferase involved in cell wall biosynthesis
MGISNGKKPFVTVIIATYNYGPFIEEAIESVLKQKFPQNEIEIIIVDDGSTDDTALRVGKYRDRVHYIYKKNGGLASALNKGFEKAQGEIIAFLDSDDYWDICKLGTIVNRFEQSGSIDYVYHDLNIIDNNGNIITTYFERTYPNLKNEFNDIPQKIEFDRYIRGQLIPPFPPTSGISIRARCLQNIMPVPEHYRVCTDTYLHFFTIFYAREGVLLKEPLGYYRFHGDNITEDGSLLSGSTMTKTKLKQLIHVYTLLIKDIKKYGQDTSYNTKLLEAEFKSWVNSWEVALNPTFLNAKLIFRTHYRILKYEGLKRYFLYSYQYRKKQIFGRINKVFKSNSNT